MKNIKEEKEKKLSSNRWENEKEFIRNIYKVEDSLFSKILNVILWGLLLAWIFTFSIDFFRYVNKSDPIFCISRKLIEYEDGLVTICTGAGYKVVSYERKDLKGYDMVFFWEDEIQDYTR